MIVEPKEDVVMEGHISEQMVLQCELSRSSGEVHWFKDGLQVLETENIQLTSEGPYRRLTVLCGSAEDSGEYVCDTDGDSVFFQVTITGKILQGSIPGSFVVSGSVIVLNVLGSPTKPIPLIRRQLINCLFYTITQFNLMSDYFISKLLFKYIYFF